MKLIENILLIVNSNDSTMEKIKKLGIINTTIGNTYFINPSFEDCKFLSCTVVTGEITKIGITLCEKLCLYQISNKLEVNPIVRYNFYDEVSVFNFPKKNYDISISIKGYYESKDECYFINDKPISLKDIFFDELDIRPTLR